MDALTRLTDDELVKRYELGDSKAFEELLFRYQSKVFAYIFLFVRDRELTEDIFQDTFMKAIVTIQQGKYVESGKFLSWLNRIAHNLIVDYFRREELSFKEIADRTGVSINTALGRMRYALINMRRMAVECNIHLELK